MSLADIKSELFNHIYEACNRNGISFKTIYDRSYLTADEKLDRFTELVSIYKQLDKFDNARKEWQPTPISEVENFITQLNAIIDIKRPEDIKILAELKTEAEELLKFSRLELQIPSKDQKKTPDVVTIHAKEESKPSVKTHKKAQPIDLLDFLEPLRRRVGNYKKHQPEDPSQSRPNEYDWNLNKIFDQLNDVASKGNLSNLFKAVSKAAKDPKLTATDKYLLGTAITNKIQKELSGSFDPAFFASSEGQEKRASNLIKDNPEPKNKF